MKERKKMKMNNEKDEGVDYSRHLYTNMPGRERIGRGILWYFFPVGSQGNSQ